MPGGSDSTTTKFKVDISELKKSMQDARRQISLANSEFKSSSSAMGDWENSADGISAKLKQLDNVLKSQNKILDSLEQQYEQVAAEQGTSSAAAERLKIAINNQKAAINKTEAEIKSYSNRLEEVEQAEKIAAQSGKTVAEALDDMGREARNAGDGFSILKGGLAVLAGNLMTGFVNALKDGAKALMGLSAETREYREDMAKLETAFTVAGFTTQEATAVYKDFYAVLGEEDRSVEAVNHLAKMVDNEKDLSTWTDICTGVWATFGDSLPIEGLTEAANETAKVGQVTGPLADALNWAGISEDEFNSKLAACTTEQERQKLIMDTLNDTYAEAAQKYNETNESVMEANRAQSDYTDTIAALGAKVEPVMTALKRGVTALLQGFLELIDGADIAGFTETIQSGFSFLANEILPVVITGLANLGKGIGEFFGWVNKLLPVISGLGVALGGLALAGLAQNFMSIVAALKAWALTTPLVTAAQWLLNAAMAANPITLIIVAIVALVAAFVVLWKKSEAFRNFWIGLWEGIKSAAGAAKDWILDKVEAIASFFTETLPNALGSVKEWISANWQSLLLMLINPFAGLFKYFYDNNSKFKEFVDTAVTFIKELPGKIWEWLVQTIAKVGEWATNMIQQAQETASNFVTNAITFISQLPGKIWTWLVGVITKVVEWRMNMIQKAIEIGTNFVTTIANWFSQLPGKVWTWLVNVVSNVISWATNIANKAREAGSNFVNKVIEYVSQLPGKIWTWLSNAVAKVAQWATSLATKGREAAQSLVNAVVEKASELPGKILSIGGQVVEGLWNGISNKATWLKNKISGFVGNVTSWLKKFFQIGSPSKLMEKEIGRWLPEGIAVGIDKNAKSVLSSVKSLVGDTISTTRGSLGAIRGATGGTRMAAGSVVNNYYQTINSPKQLSRFEIYRQSKNLLGLAGGGR